MPRPIDHVGVQRLKNGLNAVGVAPIAGRVSGTILTKVADLAEAVDPTRPEAASQVAAAVEVCDHAAPVRSSEADLARATLSRYGGLNPS